MRTKYKLAVELDTQRLGKPRVYYTCPKCGHRNKHYWFGREFHYCTKCDYKTEIKGATV